MRIGAIRGLLTLAAVAIGFAAADTYVVVLALPDMMTSAGLSIDELPRAAPIVSGFLLGYVAVLPLIGRISDLRGRLPVLVGALVLFALGSVITGAGHDLAAIVVGRFVQGVGGGGLIPPTLALIADTWAPKDRGLPLGIVGAVQEVGSVAGPLYGAAVLAFGTWRDIFWLNCAVGLLLAAAMLRLRPASGRRRIDVVGTGLLVLAVGCLVVLLGQPERLVTGVTSGIAFLPLVGSSPWLSPLAVAVYLLLVLFVVWQFTSSTPTIDVPGWVSTARATDLWGALALTVALASIIVVFAAADPQSAEISADAPVLVPIGVAALAVFWWRQRTSPTPLVPRGAMRARPAWGAVVVSFLVGAALIAALVDVPFFARLTTERNDQLGAALVLVRFLVALPVGAVLGGWLLRRFPAALIVSAAMTGSALCFWIMSDWSTTALESSWSTLTLVCCGLGFGLAIAPVNAVLLDHTDHQVHGVTSALLVVGRMIGMLIGISVLSALGLQEFRQAIGALPPVEDLCGSASACSAYRSAVREAGIAQLNAIFAGAAVCAGVCAVAAATLLTSPRTR